MPRHPVITLSGRQISLYHGAALRLIEDFFAGRLKGISNDRLRSDLDTIGTCRVCGAEPVPGARAVSCHRKWFYCLPCARSKGLV